MRRDLYRRREGVPMALCPTQGDENGWVFDRAVRGLPAHNRSWRAYRLLLPAVVREAGSPSEMDTGTDFFVELTSYRRLLGSRILIYREASQDPCLIVTGRKRSSFLRWRT